MKAEKIQDFKQKAFDFLSLFEGFKPRAYYDSKGIPHIGCGFNLTDKDVFNKVFDVIFIGLSKNDFNEPRNQEYTALVSRLRNGLWNGEWKATKLKGDDQKLQEAIQDIIKKHLKKEKDFALTESQAQEIVKESLIPKYCGMLERRLESKINDKKLSKKILQELQNSYEYIALLSLAYINTDSLIGPKLCSALKNNNRFKAWFEIRYNSNLEKSIGTAKRRFAESNVFGLLGGYSQETFNNTISWANHYKPTFHKAVDLYINLYSKFEKEGCNTYFEYVKYYENNKIFNGTTISSIAQQENEKKKPKDFVYHYKPYTEVFSPFVKTFNKAMENAECQYSFELDDIFVVNQENRSNIAEAINKRSAKRETAIIIGICACLGFSENEKIKIKNSNKLHIIFTHDNHIDCLGFEYPQKLAFYTLEDDKIKKLKGCDNPLIHQSFSFRDITISGLAQYDTNGQHIHCFKSLFDNRCSPNLSVYDKKTLKLIATIYNLCSEGDNNA